MLKSISRIRTTKEGLCVLVKDFALTAPGLTKDYEHINLELTRGKASKVIQPSLVEQNDTAGRRQSLSLVKTLHFDESFLYFS